jgi:hypothetical protein
MRLRISLGEISSPHASSLRWESHFYSQMPFCRYSSTIPPTDHLPSFCLAFFGNGIHGMIAPT